MRSLVNFKYSKSSSFYHSCKKDYFSDNAYLLKNAKIKNEFYACQPLRTHCKLCESALPQNADFSSHGVDYIFCTCCSHLNGKYEDTEQFVKKLYIDSSGSNYSENYIDDDFSKRTNDIYAPKVNFLSESLPLDSRTLLDVGCGAGHFVFAALSKGYAASGIDVNFELVDFGNAQINHLINACPLSHTEKEDSLYEAIVSTEANVVTAIGVIEHLRKPSALFEAFKRSRAKYIYYSVPMFSLSVVLENIFKDVYPRHLSMGHTHLFTEESILKLHERFEVNPVAEWGLVPKVVRV